MDNTPISRAQKAKLDDQARKAAEEAAILIVETAGYGYETAVKQQHDMALAMLTAFTGSPVLAALMLDMSIDFILEACPDTMVPTASYRKAHITRAIGELVAPRFDTTGNGETR